MDLILYSIRLVVLNLKCKIEFEVENRKITNYHWKFNSKKGERRYCAVPKNFVLLSDWSYKIGRFAMRTRDCLNVFSAHLSVSDNSNTCWNVSSSRRRRCSSSICCCADSRSANRNCSAVPSSEFSSSSLSSAPGRSSGYSRLFVLLYITKLACIALKVKNSISIINFDVK